MTDAERETILDTLAMLAFAASTSDQRHYWGNLFKAEHKNRSPEQVSKMELERGLSGVTHGR